MGVNKKMSSTQNIISKEVPKNLQRHAENCPECTSKNLVHDYDSGETICGDCGLVLY
jgi:transcription initiation factor TFIIB